MAEFLDAAAAANDWLAGLDPSRAIAVDTEFIRERTYYPILALVQLAQDGRVGLIDPIVLGASSDGRGTLKLLGGLIRAASPCIMHSAGEDLGVLGHALGIEPDQLFDTQLAGALAGLGASLGYAPMVKAVLDIELAKSQTRSDWQRRPLSQAQLEYAADDVRHLEELHAILAARLAARGREAWLTEETERLACASRLDVDDPQPHLGFRPAAKLSRPQQALLRRLLFWREAQARRSDRPRKWVLDNPLALDLAQRPPATREALDARLDQSPRAPKKLAEAIWCEVERPLKSAELDLPLIPAETPDRDRTRAIQQAVAELAAANELPAGLLASRRVIERWIEAGEWRSSVDGWRRELLVPVLDPLFA